MLFSFDLITLMKHMCGESLRFLDSPSLKTSPTYIYLSSYISVKSFFTRTSESSNMKLSLIAEAKYDDDILSRFNYNVKIAPWLKEGISQ